MPCSLFVLAWRSGLAYETSDLRVVGSIPAAGSAFCLAVFLPFSFVFLFVWLFGLFWPFFAQPNHCEMIQEGPRPATMLSVGGNTPLQQAPTSLQWRKSQRRGRRNNIVSIGRAIKAGGSSYYFCRLCTPNVLLGLHHLPLVVVPR